MNSCPRAWEAEAGRDGRLSGRERAQFERHVEGCAVCAREQSALNALATELQALPLLEADELSLRRRRHELLARANEERLEPRSRSQHRLLWAVAACLLLSGSALASYRWYAQQQRAAPMLALEAGRGASYRSALEHGMQVITLEQGRLSLRVQRGGAAHGVRILTPDGEIEDIGTTFSVVVDQGRTQLVEVSEGQVWVDLRGLPPHMVAAGDCFWPYGRPTISHEQTDREAASAEPTPALGDTEQTRSARSTEPAHAHRDKGQPAAGEREFRAAVQRLERGDAAAAAALFAAFELRHLRHALAEDASYLRVVALLRAGDKDEAQRAASSYLRRYPSGFRRPDVLKLLQR